MNILLSKNDFNKNPSYNYIKIIIENKKGSYIIKTDEVYINNIKMDYDKFIKKFIICNASHAFLTTKSGNKKFDSYPFKWPEIEEGYIEDYYLSLDDCMKYEVFKEIINEINSSNS